MPQRRTFPLQDYVWVKQGKGEHSGRRQRVTASASVGEVVSKSSNNNNNGDTLERQSPTLPNKALPNVYMIVAHNDFRAQAMVDCYRVKWCSSGKWDYVPVADCRPMYSDSDDASTSMSNMEQHSSSVLLDASDSASDAGASGEDQGCKQSPPPPPLRRSSHRAVSTPDRFGNVQAAGLMPPTSKKRKVAALAVVSTTASYPTVEAKIQKPQALSSLNGHSQNLSLQSVLPNQFVGKASDGTKQATVVSAPPQALSIVNDVAAVAAPTAANPVDIVVATASTTISTPKVTNNLVGSFATATTTTAISATKAGSNDKVDSARLLDEMMVHEHGDDVEIDVDIDESDQHVVASTADHALPVSQNNHCKKPLAVAANYTHPKSSVTSKTTTSHLAVDIDDNGKKNVPCPFCVSGTAGTSSRSVTAPTAAHPPPRHDHGHVYRKAGIVGDSQFYNRYRHLPDSVQLAPLRYHGLPNKSRPKGQQSQRQAHSHFFSVYVTERQCLELFDASQGAILVPFCGEHALLPAE